VTKRPGETGFSEQFVFPGLEAEPRAREEPPRPRAMPAGVADYPELRYMGGKKRLLPWIHEVLTGLDFDSAFDPFAGSGAVAYLMKAMGKQVTASDFLQFSATVAQATIANNQAQLDAADREYLFGPAADDRDFIQRTYDGIFYNATDRAFLDRASANIDALLDPGKQALARAALIRAALKRQPRGVFTVSGDLSRYNDGRRDLRLSLEAHFQEQIQVFNGTVRDNGRTNTAFQGSVFDEQASAVPADLVYLDPPYVPRSDDNCYVKRYHFLEGLACYWRGLEIDYTTKVRKIPKKYTPFSYRRTATEAFDQLFRQFADRIIVLSYSSNGYPDLATLEELMGRYKAQVVTYQRPHRYHFGTHGTVKRANVDEYLIVGT